MKKGDKTKDGVTSREGRVVPLKVQRKGIQRKEKKREKKEKKWKGKEDGYGHKYSSDQCIIRIKIQQNI